jgi:type IV secretory pathway VirB6-like protein
VNGIAIFHTIFEQFDVQFMAAVNSTANNMLAAVAPLALFAIAAWIAGTMAIELYSPGAEPLMLFVRKIIRAALLVALLTAASYTELFEKFALTTLPNELIAAATGNTQGTGALTPDAFDRLLQGGWGSAMLIIKNVSAWSPQSVLLALIAAIEFIVGGLFIAVGFVVWISTHVSLGLLITIGPLMICTMLWDKTLFMFRGWISTLLSLIMSQVLLVAFLALLLVTANNLLQAMATANTANINDIAAQVAYIVSSGMLYLMVFYLSPKILGLAQSVIGVASPGIAAMSQMVHSAVGGSVSGAAGAGGRASAAGGAGSAAPVSLSGGKAAMRSTTPAGKALG